MVASALLAGCGETSRVLIDAATRSWNSVTGTVVDGEAVLEGNLRLGRRTESANPHPDLTAGAEKVLPNPWFGT